MKKSIIAIAAIAALTATSSANAAGWKDKYKEIGFGVIPVETQTETTKTMDGFAAYAAKKLGVPVKIFTASEFIGINNALLAGQIQMGWTSPSAYSGTWLECNGCVEPLVTATDKDGNLGYNSVLIVKADSPFKKFEDLQGKTVARTEPNSQSGYLVPTVEFSKMGKPVDQFFKAPVSGGHTQSVLGVLNGTYDAAFTWTTKGDGYGQIRTMIDKGMLKREQIRVIWESGLVPPPPVIIRSDLPADLKADLTKLFVDLHKDSMELAEAVAKGKTQGFVPVKHDTYELTVEMRKQLKALRKGS
ncbi:MAG: phosphate/phosphite/phosphonate ABC transporter substrate-binding protein [Pseudolabrys sp.]|nr:phosphate/phosphite/phosphonate ABC transporter substrate-binding protein [Pseudolabrys sp.]MDP2295669.1 phosphate/phosphite/phosphonate ABC transporter substrate-binding protein [Pseudolabrys sp.]